jgi:hypothetical protein
MRMMRTLNSDGQEVHLKNGSKITREAAWSMAAGRGLKMAPLRDIEAAHATLSAEADADARQKIADEIERRLQVREALTAELRERGRSYLAPYLKTQAELDEMSGWWPWKTAAQA